MDGDVDLAVHSLKDIPTVLAEGLALPAVLERERPAGCPGRCTWPPRSLLDLPHGARIGTSSLRRRAQLLALRPDLHVEDLRGNLDTRLQRVEDGDYNAAILALAGILRLGFDAEVSQILDAPEWLPAVGQGALGITTRANDTAVIEIVRALDHAPTRAETTAERAFLRELEGGCQIPIGALGIAQDTLTLNAIVASVDGINVVRGRIEGSLDDAADLGRSLADQLRDRGAGRILDELRAQNGQPRPAAP